ncbi:MAG TPA: HAMP domain-containing sensor histidine kinase [Candidatus Sumerlaeota bacterium]|nr:MAG: Alkaline phosphatase synthesis sensor protein PhoR [candidate division BRC1 bacterium ADurb.Bin183]HON51232.1 HAMP domain-containing sensor histidine kinase [Candidatus Sumerlaeota bacterium]HRR30034.1 HAMP domain-containing sensor histidine kinase [Candidatus Sumerlaeia bacterium]HOR64451.1 HAMP domain-containing sensor histidine kinase [Candidatus Sumerlaeota bacterium]HPL73819.1 HAMP domain-containing sensor histidine kinase [Candidatus Sumerlaeota bacterium]
MAVNTSNPSQSAENPATYFAPAERADPEQILDASRMVENSLLFNAILESVDGYIMILNPQRQVLAMNRKLLEDINIHDINCILGERPGEVLKCIHAAEGPGGCGTGKFCSSCGAVISILASQKKGKPVTDECLATVQHGETVESLEFRVRSTPVKLGDSEFIVLVLHDISGDKRRQALERTFFHDVLNTVGGLIGWSNLLRDFEGTDPKQAAERIILLSKRLQQEIEEQRRLSQAEMGTLEIETATGAVQEIFNNLKTIFEAHPVAKNKMLEVVNADPAEEITTDISLLTRIITNMIKNAFEAIQPSQTVRLWFAMREDAPTFFVQNPGKIPDETAMRIFQRSFSTKSKTGRGIGTYSMKLFGERYLKGQVGFETSEENGTIFYISLPAKT